MTYAPQRSTNHEARGPGRFLEQFKNKAIMTALLLSYLRRIQELEDATWEVIFSRNLQDGEGVVLDSIGVLVGRLREGLGDDDYKVSLRAKIRINRTQGKPEDIIDVVSLSLPVGVPFAYTEWYPCTVQVEIQVPVTFKVSILFRNLVMTKAGGVRLFLVVMTAAPEDSFTFAEWDPGGYITETQDTHAGFGSHATILLIGLGGQLVYVLSS